MGFDPLQALELAIQDLHDLCHRRILIYLTFSGLVQISHDAPQAVVHLLQLLIDVSRTLVALLPSLRIADLSTCWLQMTTSCSCLVAHGGCPLLAHARQTLFQPSDIGHEVLLIDPDRLQDIVQFCLFLLHIQHTPLERNDIVPGLENMLIPLLHLQSLFREGRDVFLQIPVPEGDDLGHSLLLQTTRLVSQRFLP